MKTLLKTLFTTIAMKSVIISYHDLQKFLSHHGRNLADGNAKTEKLPIHKRTLSAGL